MSTIDPIESVLAVIGVRCLISKEVETFTKSQLDESTKLPKTVERMVKQLTADDLIDLPLFETNYDRTLKDLFDEWQPQQVEAMSKSMEKWVPGVTVGLMAKAKEVLEYLKSIFPRSTYQTFLGTTHLVPNDPAIYAFESTLEVLDSPTKVFALMQQGAITKRQIAAVRQLYPTLSAFIDETLVSIVADRKVETKSYELPPAAEVGVSKWYGQPAISPALSAQLQAVAPKPKQPSPPVPAATSPKTSVLAKESLSSAERATYGALK